MPPFLGGGSMIRRVTIDGFEPAELPAKFEAGTPPIVPAIGLGAAIDYLNQIGIEAIHAHERTLCARAHEVLATVGGVRFLGPAPEQKAGIVSFMLDGVHAHDIAQLLDRQGDRRPRRPSLRDAAAQATGHHRQHAGQLLFLQHAGRSRATRHGRGRDQAILQSQEALRAVSRTLVSAGIESAPGESTRAIAGWGPRSL